jgi:hypothetical protein
LSSLFTYKIFSNLSLTATLFLCILVNSPDKNLESSQSIKNLLLSLSFTHDLYNVKANSFFYNKCNQTTSGFDVAGFTTVKDKNGNTFMVSCNDDRLKTGELVGVADGQKTPPAEPARRSRRRP